MAFNLSGDLEKQLNASRGLAGNDINPSNLENTKFTPVRKVPDFTKFSSETAADAEIDSVTNEAEAKTQQERVVKAYTHLANVENKLQKSMDALRKAYFAGEVTIEEAFGNWQTMKHKLNLKRREVALDNAYEEEAANIGFGSFQRGLKQKLYDATDTSRKGTHAGSSLEQEFAAIARIRGGAA